MPYPLKIAGAGHKVGSRTLRNADLARSLDLEEDWFERRTGIVTRCVCSEDENVLSLARDATQAACCDAGLDRAALGHETVLIHVQNGLTHITPPSGIVLCHELGLNRCRNFSLDGVCGEVINAVEIGAMMLAGPGCDRVIVSSSVDFEAFIDQRDTGTAGLFGSGAGALILERDGVEDGPGGVRGIYWETQAEYWDLGTIDIQDVRRDDSGVSIRSGFYAMRGKALAKVVLNALKRVLGNTLDQAGWELGDVDFVITHQPNAKLLEVAFRRLNLPMEKTHMSAPYLGNMGPASLLVAFSIAKERELVEPGQKILLVSVGLGVSCGAVAIQL